MNVAQKQIALYQAAKVRWRAEHEAEVLEAQLRLLVEIHEMMTAPWADENEVKGHLTRRKNSVRNKLKQARRRAVA